MSQLMADLTLAVILPCPWTPLNDGMRELRRGCQCRERERASSRSAVHIINSHTVLKRFFACGNFLKINNNSKKTFSRKKIQ